MIQAWLSSCASSEGSAGIEDNSSFCSCKMSWKLAEWRWREQMPLRERSLWKIWDVEDAVRSGDSVEETVRFAYHFPDQVEGCWQSRVEIIHGRGLGSIRSGTNPHPPPLSQLPELPSQNHTSYHPSHSSSAPLLGTTEKTSLALGGSHSTTSSILVLLSKSPSSTPTICATPRTPQLATDFLNSRDWNHLAIDQKVNSEAAGKYLTFANPTCANNSLADQLRSSFGLFSKANNRPHSEPYPRLASQYRSLGRGMLHSQHLTIPKLTRCRQFSHETTALQIP